MVIGWYITADMILSIVASILTFLIAKRPKLGLLLTIAVFIGSMAITFGVTYVNQYDGLMKISMRRVRPAATWPPYSL